MLSVLLFLFALRAVAQADGDDVAAVTTVPPPAVCCGTEELRQALSQLVQEQRELASGQAEVVRLLRTMKDQGAQQVTDLHGMARHQSLLVENNQALLQQVSRIANLLQEVSKKLQIPVMEEKP